MVMSVYFGVHEEFPKRKINTPIKQRDCFRSINYVVLQVGATLGEELSHKKKFISDQISLLQSKGVRLPVIHKQSLVLLNHHKLFASDIVQDHFFSTFAIQYHRSRQWQQEIYPDVYSQYDVLPPLPSQGHVAYPLPGHAAAPPLVLATTTATAVAASNVASVPKESATSGKKRRGGPGGLNKVCGVSPELQAIVGQPAMPRTEILKQLWLYIRKHNLQDPRDKRKIICDDALQAVFETDCTDMFKMNKLLAKHIIPLDPSKQAEQADQAKRLKVEADSVSAKVEQPSSAAVAILDSLAKLLEVEKKRCSKQRS